MAITLDLPTIPLPSPITPASMNPVAAVYYKLMAPSMTEAQRLALAAYYLAYALKLGTPTDYTSNHKQLIDDGLKFGRGISGFDFQAAIATNSFGLAYSFAVANSQTVVSDVNTALNSVNDLWVLPNDTLRKIVAMLIFRSNTGG